MLFRCVLYVNKVKIGLNKWHGKNLEKPRDASNNIWPLESNVVGCITELFARSRCGISKY